VTPVAESKGSIDFASCGDCLGAGGTVDEAIGVGGVQFSVGENPLLRIEAGWFQLAAEGDDCISADSLDGFELVNVGLVIGGPGDEEATERVVVGSCCLCWCAENTDTGN
jgi:hypothetical protein